MRPTRWPSHSAMYRPLNSARASTLGRHELPPPALSQKFARAARTAELQFRASEPSMTRTDSKPRLLLSLLAVIVLVPVGRAAPGGATITYRRVFKGSTPEFIEIKIA